jgi:hypothetical protein
VYSRNRLLTALVAVLALGQVVAQTELSIGFFDKRVYVPGAEVLVKVTMRNSSPAVWRFKLADDKRLSITFDVKTMSNRPLEPSDSWKRKMASSTPIFYRELTIEPGEEYSFVEDLRDYVRFTEPGVFMVSCALYPELTRGVSSETAMRSNTLALSIRPGSPAPSAAESFRADTNDILKAERIGPDEVVARTIQARQKSLWNEFFLYLDVESLLKANPEKKRMYDRESDDGRRRMLSAYRTDLMASVVDSDIVVIPSSFEIIETRFGASSGKVTVVEKFKNTGFSMIKEYTYELERRDDIWFIVSYTVINKGTE